MTVEKSSRRLLLVVLLFLPSFLYAQYYSDAEIVPAGSAVYTQVRSLFHEAGMQNFTRTLPVTVYELRQSLKRIPVGRLSAESVKLLDELLLSHQPEKDIDRELKTSLTLSVDAYANTNTDYTAWVDNTTRRYYENGDSSSPDYVDVSDKVYDSTDGNREFGYKDRHSPLHFDFSYPLNDIFFGQAALTLGKDPFQTGVPDDNYTNILTASDQFDLMIPYRAYISGGAKNLYFQFGRDRLSWGNGVTGNMIVSDAPLYYDFFSFSFFDEKFKYSFVMIGLETWLLDRDFVYNPDGTLRNMDDANSNGVPDSVEDAKAYYEDIKYFLGHRLEFYPRSNLFIALSENTIYGGKPITLNYINPFMIYHSYYVQGYGNSFMTLELNYSPVKILNLYGQVGVDQYQTPMEVASGWGGDREPGAMGYLAGFSCHPEVLGKRLVFGYEWAYTSPYLYYGNQLDHDEPYGGNSPVLAVSSRRRIQSLIRPTKVKSYVDQSIGYFTGPDSVVHFFYLDFPAIIDGLEWGAEVTWIQKGERYMSTQFYVPEGRGSLQGPTGTVENKIITELWAIKKFGKDIVAGGQVDIIGYKNLHHNRGDDGIDIQFALYCSWKVF